MIKKNKIHITSSGAKIVGSDNFASMISIESNETGEIDEVVDVVEATEENMENHFGTKSINYDKIKVTG